MMCSFEEEFVDVIAVGVDQQEQEEGHADHLGILQHFDRRLAARNDLPKSEDNVAAVEGRDGQDVHKRQDNREEGGEVPVNVLFNNEILKIIT